MPEIKAAFFFGLEHIPKTAVCTNIESALVEASQSFPDHDVVLLNMCGSQPKIFFPRMLGTWNAQLSLDVLSPLHLEQDSFSGLPAVNLDAITYQRSKHQLYMSKHAIDHGSFIRNTVISKLVINDHDSSNAAKCDCVVVSSRENISSNGEQVAGSDNEKPSILHVLHSWGGGIDFFAKDLKKGDLDRNHFFLKSHSRDNAAPFGKELCLYHSLEEEPVAQWFLAEQIADTQIESNEVARILKSIIERWAIGAVLVSSLIGHSLDVLDTGLPTALAIHDVYPFWPLLHDSNLEDTSKEYLAEALESQRQDIIFQPHSAPYW